MEEINAKRLRNKAANLLKRRRARTLIDKIKNQELNVINGKSNQNRQKHKEEMCVQFLP